MNRPPRFVFCAALLWLAAPHGYGQAAPAAPAAPKGFDAFAVVKTRNIFDPNRKPMRSDATQESRASSGKTIRPSYFTLTGTMVAEGRSLAFFTGSRSDFSKVIPIGELVAGYKVVSITPIQTEMEHDGKTFVLAIGNRQQIEGSTDEVSGPDLAGPDSNTSPSPSGPNAPNGAAPAASTDKTEILRRMMERARAERGN